MKLVDDKTTLMQDPVTLTDDYLNAGAIVKTFKAEKRQECSDLNKKAILEKYTLVVSFLLNGKARPSRFSDQRARRKNIWVGRSEK